jgi:hypothetical protein
MAKPNAVWRLVLGGAPNVEEFEITSPIFSGPYSASSSSRPRNYMSVKKAPGPAVDRYRRGKRPISLSLFAQRAYLEKLAVVGFMVEPPRAGTAFAAMTRLILEASPEAYDVEDMKRIVAAMPELRTLYVSIALRDTLKALACCCRLKALKYVWLRGNQRSVGSLHITPTTASDVAEVRWPLLTALLWLMSSAQLPGWPDMPEWPDMPQIRLLALGVAFEGRRWTTNRHDLFRSRVCDSLRERFPLLQELSFFHHVPGARHRGDRVFLALDSYNGNQSIWNDMGGVPEVWETIFKGCKFQPMVMQYTM